MKGEKEGLYMESMNIHPISGGVAPLYSPLTPSDLMVLCRQSRAPWNWVLVCNRTFRVSKLRHGQWRFLFESSSDSIMETYGCPTKTMSAQAQISK